MLEDPRGMTNTNPQWQQTSGYTCIGCGMWILYGVNHACKGYGTSPAVDHGFVYEAYLLRIAEALEKIERHLNDRRDG